MDLDISPPLHAPLLQRPPAAPKLAPGALLRPPAVVEVEDRCLLGAGTGMIGEVGLGLDDWLVEEVRVVDEE